MLSEPQPEDHWTGRTGLVHEAILADFPDLSGHQVYACGSVEMVEAAHPAFTAHGHAAGRLLLRCVPARAAPRAQGRRRGHGEARGRTDAMSATREQVVGYALQAVCYAAFMAVVGYFSTSPPYVHLPRRRGAGASSRSSTPAQRKEACRERSAEELAKLAPNMRARSRLPARARAGEVEVEMDGKPLFTVVAPPTGLSRDGAATVYRRVAVPAGAHTLRREDERHAGRRVRPRGATAAIELEPGRVLVIDFDAKEGGWLFRG